MIMSLWDYYIAEIEQNNCKNKTTDSIEIISLHIFNTVIVKIDSSRNFKIVSTFSIP